MRSILEQVRCNPEVCNILLLIQPNEIFEHMLCTVYKIKHAFNEYYFHAYNRFIVLLRG